ncbi:membrane lipoprotein lipid attachment site-containing protein [Sporosarcina sp. E16_8]|uniref:membrane lipoprotein lipid attachment site-containing protein n=1 Tax=Sporosarcina sp. E16_8 TaxID=2789295 RepID=UPI001A938CD7|nr:membrane lipoprotein lipid attachment site-containing protein [Sporosarcina sp. E16_8]MBO0586345.1 membrane lipoprotein lipid attachment site-containing protein [Sporosarcina sp. E16_8]
MKRLLCLFIAILLLTACGNDSTKEEPGLIPKVDDVEEIQTQVNTEDKEVETEIDEPEKELNEYITPEEVKEILEDAGMGEEDKLVSASVEDVEIKAVIETAPDDLFSADVLAVTRYSQASDELLDHEGWQVLTIEYVDIGTISMNRSEKETNEYDMDYFPTEEIEKRLK